MSRGAPVEKQGSRSTAKLVRQAHLELDAERYVLPVQSEHWSLPGSASLLLVGYVPARQGRQAAMPASAQRGWKVQTWGYGAGWWQGVWTEQHTTGSREAPNWHTVRGESRGAPVRGAYVLAVHAWHVCALLAGVRVYVPVPVQKETSPLPHGTISARSYSVWPRSFSLYPAAEGRVWGRANVMGQWGSQRRSAVVAKAWLVERKKG